MSDPDASRPPQQPPAPEPPGPRPAPQAARYPARRRAPGLVTATLAPALPGPARVTADRYRTYRQPRPAARQRAERPPRQTPGTIATASDAFRRARHDQAQHRRPIARLRRIASRHWFIPGVLVPTALIVAVFILLLPLLWSTIRAYRNVTVDDIQHNQDAYVAQINPAGTAEIVEKPTEIPLGGWNGKDRITILLLGADMTVDGASRTDTIILVNIDPATNSATMMSIPRDLKVLIPGYGLHKINAAFAIGEKNQVQGGGAGLTIRTIEENLGIHVSAFVQIDFQGFIAMIDTLGGIDVNNPYPVKDDTYPADNYNYQRIYFPVGWQHLDGEDALVYARTRHQDGDGRRSVRQQQVIMALRQRAINLDILGDLPRLIDEMGNAARTNLTLPDMLRLANVGITMPRQNIHQLSMMSAVYEDIGDDGIYYLSADWTEMQSVLTEFAGKPIYPQGAALANPNYDAPIMILNGTGQTGLAARVADILTANGFWNVSVGDARNPGDVPHSLAADNRGDIGTSVTVLSLIGVSTDTLADSARTDLANAGASRYSDYALVIVLGDDAPDPQIDEWTLSDYEAATGDRIRPVGSPSGSPIPSVPAADWDP